MIHERLTKSSTFRIKTQPNTMELLNQKSKYHRYDTSLYHKTNFHLRPIKQNPQLYTKAEQSLVSKFQKVNKFTIIPSSISSKSVHATIKRAVTQPKQKQKQKQNPKQKEKEKEKKKQNQKPGQKQKLILLPQSISIRSELTKFSGLDQSLQKLLEQDTTMLVTAKKWIIFDMQTNSTLKGYKHKKQHDVASLTKILTFYTCYKIIQKYYLSIDRMELYIDSQDECIQGTKIPLKAENLVTLEDLLYAMMLESANNAATALATNLGSLVRKKRQGKYFSCFDVPNQKKEENLDVFLEIMNGFAAELGVQGKFLNVHGMCKNKASARDIALLLSQCYKIPLFSKIAISKHHTLIARYISDKGQLSSKQIAMTNTNKLLWLGTGCIGGKTGCNSIGGESLAACYQGSIIVVVLGSAGREEKFMDCEKLVGWLWKKLAG